MTWPGGNNLDHLLRIITENKASLKKLLGIPEALFGQLPEGLVLDEFSTSNVKPRDVKIPALNTKVFKYNIADDMKIPLAFMRNVNAEEIHLQINRLLPDSSKNPRPFGVKPGNDRTKKLRVEFDGDLEGSMDFDRMFREVAACCPKLECFELVHKKRFDDYTFTKYTCAVDNLVAGFEQAMKEADTAQYKVHLKTYAWYSYYTDEPEETNFSCGLLKTNLPPSEEVDPDKRHSYFVKEMSTDGRNIRVDCEILEGSESDGESDFDDSWLHEADYDYGDYEDEDEEPYGYGYDDY
ncbi:hypothetical protein AAVH_39533 [Aphelenchoides avenae]|nr:hypothetical protein AAVH_39533 [Aphelenchus avenae]